ncbi:hypothetical protein Purlil1_13262 [Purpureocillium lilacinum]|uniref:Uncharacterized protein n=1 Tax=Purpureocillium lilacinum TaxID=33203 RepID=A0ABR0BEI8_PURLI|nr:hypothetical protein Purlil1_13262 [Purpureocillium lilacinum]
MSSHDFAADMPPSSTWLHRRDMEPVAPHSADHFAPSQPADAYPIFGIVKSMNTATGLHYRPPASTTSNYHLPEQRSAVLPGLCPPLTNPDCRIGSHAASDSSNSSIFKVCKSTSQDSTTHGDQPVALDADMFRRWPEVADLSKPQPDRVQSERDDDKTYDTIHVRIRN